MMKKVSDAEYEIMQIIWNKREITSNEIIRELRSDKWKNNTIRTLISRLLQKKAIGIVKKEGRTYYYVPLYDEKKYKAFITKEYVKLMFNGSFVDFVMCCLENSNENIDDIKEIIQKAIKSKKD